MIARQLLPTLARSRKSILLLGPRQTGKSTLITQLKPDLSLNLMHEPTFLEFARNPYELEQRLRALPTTRQSVFIDEIQRLPSLLNTLQTVMDNHPDRYRFLLTGSSARKLRRGQANLLPGRIHTYFLGPLVAAELGTPLDLAPLLSTGSLPGIWTDAEVSSRQKTLRSYAATYLKEEIQAESLSRNLEGFARFLTVMGAWSGQFIDLAKIAAAAQAPRQSVVRWLEILEDTLLARRVHPFAKSATRRLVQHPRLFFFDVGVLNGLLGNFVVSADRRGGLFEHWIFSQLVHSAAAFDRELQISTFRTEHGAEVDLIVEGNSQLWAIELKASSTVGSSDLRGLNSFQNYVDKRQVQARVWYEGPVPKKLGNIDVLPWPMGLRELGF